MFRPALRRSLSALSAALPQAFLGFAAPASAAVVIGQVYGTGGNSGATFKHDFIEIFNAGSNTESIGGWSVQYAAAAATSRHVTAITPSATLAAGRHYLIRQAPGAGGTVDVVGDLNGTIAMSGTGGKMALTNGTAALTGSAPASALDIVSYGASTPTKGTPTGVLDSTLAAARNSAGCADSNHNSADSTLVAPAPHNSGTAPAPCPGAQAVALADLNARSRIILDDGSGLQNPNPRPYLDSNALPRAGDTVGSLTGVIDYGLATSSNTGFGDYKIHPTQAPVSTLNNLCTAAPEAVGGNVKVASFNVLNYFTTFTNGARANGQTRPGCSLGVSVSASNSRGASSLAEFVRQRAKIVEAMAALNADVLGLMEIQNNGLVAVQNLVGRSTPKLARESTLPRRCLRKAPAATPSGWP